MMSWQPDAPNPCVPERLQGICKYYGTWTFSNTCWSGCPYCIVNAKRGDVVRRDWTYEQAIAGWRNVAEKYGPWQILLSGREPLEELPLIAELLKYHYASCSTNLMVNEDALKYAVPAERLEIHASFHPVWADRFDDFLAKLLRLRDHGFPVLLVAFVGWPPMLKHWDEWIPRVREAGIMPNPVPCRGTTAIYQGRQLPEQYTDEEREIVMRHTFSDLFAEDCTLRPKPLKACAAGVATASVSFDGEIRRCISLPGYMDGQNLYRDGTLTLLDEPLPCPQDRCYCTNLHPYHITE